MASARARGDDYRALLDAYAFRFFSERIRLSEITPRHVAQFIAWLCEQTTHDGKPLSDSTVRNALNPLRSCLATAVAEGLIRNNPTNGASLPHRPVVEDDETHDIRPFTREQLRVFLDLVTPRHRLLFEVLAVTGLRISELIALEWRHLHLDGSGPHLKVRRARVKGRLEPPKSRHGRRDLPLEPALVSALRTARREAENAADDGLVFPSLAGTPINADNLRARHLKPVAEEVGASWAGFHTFRHTCASLLFERGANIKQVQRWLGHHAASFTLDVYVHLLSDDLARPLDLEAELVAPDQDGEETFVAA